MRQPWAPEPRAHADMRRHAFDQRACARPTRKYGHPLDGIRTRPGGGRYCKTCIRLNKRRQRAKFSQRNFAGLARLTKPAHDRPNIYTVKSPVDRRSSPWFARSRVRRLGTTTARSRLGSSSLPERPDRRSDCRHRRRRCGPARPPGRLQLIPVLNDVIEDGHDGKAKSDHHQEPACSN